MYLLGLALWIVLVLLAGNGSSIAGLVLFVAWIYGTYRAFRAHWALGIIALLFAPATAGLAIISVVTQHDYGKDIVTFVRQLRR